MEKTSRQKEKERGPLLVLIHGASRRQMWVSFITAVGFRFPFPSISIIQTVFDSCARRLYHGLFSVLFLCLSYLLSSFVYCCLPVFLSVCLLGSGSEGDKIP